VCSSDLNHEQVDEHALSSVAIALREQSFEEEPQLLDAIRDHPKANASTLKHVDRALVKLDYSDNNDVF
jgi:predicted hydrolase (HD superfamily)